VSGAPPDRRDGVSVVTATLGRRGELLAKLAALEVQTLDRSRFEWLVAFDGASPQLERDLCEAAAGGIDLRTVTSGGVGPGPARDAAARLARFPVLLLSDDDCLPDPDTLERHLEAQRSPGVAVGTVVFVAGGAETVVAPPKRPGWWNLAGANTSLPTDAFRAVGGFGDATAGYGGEDLWLGWRLHRAGLPFRPAATARVRHLGPDPQRSGDRRKAYQAGANAVRLARRERALAWRLGVHPVILRAKALVLGLPWPGPEPARRAYEREYARGARDGWAGRDANAAPDAPGAREDER
jgi:GT2 family glycosyltransferase